MSKQEQAVPRHCKRYAAQGVNVSPADYCLVAKTEYISEAAIMERDGIGNITGTAKHDAHQPSSVQELLAASNLRAVAFGAGAGEGEGNCPLWDGHIIDAIFPLV
jgi:hypothetical protein